MVTPIAPTGQTGSTGYDSNFTTDQQVLDRVAAIRRNRGLPPDPESDRIWLRRIKGGNKSIGDARTAIEGKAARQSNVNYVRPGAPGEPTRRINPGDIDTGGGSRGGSPTLGNPEEGQPRAPDYNFGFERPPAWDDGLDLKSLAPQWLTGKLLDAYIDSWSDTGNPGLALERVRRDPEYDRIFVGNRRDDGSLRYDENTYLSTRDGFRRLSGDVGFDLSPQDLRALFEGEVSLGQFGQGVSSAVQTFVEPGGSADSPLVSEFMRGFIGSGSEQVAFEEVRNSDLYDQTFVGNRREDGSLRMGEQEWFGYRRGWRRTLASYGLDPRLFEGKGRFEEAVRNEISVDELGSRIDVMANQIDANLDEVRGYYASSFGLEMTRESLLGAAIDPTIERDIFERRISAAQIGGEAKLQGFIRDLDRVERMASTGLSQQQARGVYTEASERVPTLDVLAGRYNDTRGAFGVEGFEDATVFGDTQVRQRMDRRMQDEASAFSQRGGVRQNQDGGMAGLRQR